MMYTTEIKLKSGQLYVNIDGYNWLLDTGMPVTFGNVESLCIAGDEFSVLDSYMELNASKLTELIGHSAAGVIGTDVLNQFNILFDLKRKQVSFTTDEIGLDGDTLEMVDEFMGTPIVLARISGEDRRMLFGTGFRLSYFQDKVLDTFPPAGEVTDYSSGLGQIQTETYMVDATIGGKHCKLRCGSLPELLGVRLMLEDAEGVIGNELLTDHIVGYFPKNRKLVLGCSGTHESWASIYDIVNEQMFGSYYSIFTNTIMDKVKSVVTPPARIMDIGAGTGRFTIPLASMGYNMTAVDPSEQMLNQLRRKLDGSSISIFHGAIEDFETDTPFDMAICIFTVLIYLIDENSLRNSIQTAAKAVRSGGHILIDIPPRNILQSYESITSIMFRSVSINPDHDDVYKYSEKIVLKLNGQTKVYTDHFPIRYWKKENVLKVFEEYGLLVEEEFDLANSNYLLLKKREEEIPKVKTGKAMAVSKSNGISSLPLAAWNNTAVDYPSDQCVHQLFEAQVERTPDAVAIVCEGSELTYIDLNCRANQLAHYLVSKGVGPEVLVGICAERSPEMIVGLLGVLKAGGAYVPIDPAYPKERVAFMLEDTHAPVLLTQQRLFADLPEYGAHVVCLDTFWENNGCESELNLSTEMHSSNLAYVIYTSGSTGRPKGVEIEHAGLTNLITWHQRAYNLRPTDKTIQFASPAFDACVWELWPYLTAGASIHIPGESLRVDPEGLLEWLVTEKITICFLPTPIAEAVLSQQWLESVALRTLLTGGDKLHQVHGKLPFTLVNHYGPTESTVVATSAVVRETDDEPPIGRPISNIKVYLLDSNLQLVPIGVSGELHIGGAGLARGYLNRPELTAEKFITNPFGNEGGARLYKSGDLARYLPDGNIEFLGRIDHQVKIRGFRIEIGEIENSLMQHDFIKNAVVIVYGESESKRLAAYVVLTDKAGDDWTEILRNHLNGLLPDYMIPTIYTSLEQLPVTTNGKIDRKALPAPKESITGLRSGYVEPGTLKEKKLAEIWASSLGIEKIGIYDNFIDLGGNSLICLQIVAKAHKMGISLTNQQVFEHQTIAELATVSCSTTSIDADQGVVTGIVPLFPIQHWFFELNNPHPEYWNLSVLLRIITKLDISLLQFAIKSVINHHDALRLRYFEDRNGWQQYISEPDQEGCFLHIDLSQFDEDKQISEIESIASKYQSSLNLSQGPILLFILFDLGEGKSDRLLILAHHLTVDILSLKLIAEDLETAYQQLDSGEAVHLPQKTVPLKSWAEQLESLAQSETVTQELEFWLRHGDKESCSLPVDYPTCANTVASSQTISIAFDLDESQVLFRDVPKLFSILAIDFLVSVLAEVFAEWTGHWATQIDVEGNGRQAFDIDVSRTVGWFTVLYPVQLDLHGITSVEDKLKSVKKQLRPIRNTGAGYGLLRYLHKNKQIVAKMSTLPEPEVSFLYQGESFNTHESCTLFAAANEPIGPSHHPQGNRHHLFDVRASMKNNHFYIHWLYSENVHKRETIQKLACNFRDKLRCVISYCQSLKAEDQQVSEFSASGLDQEDLNTLLSMISEE